MKNQFIFTLAAVFSAVIGFAADNLMPNPEFKGGSVCPNGWYAHQAAPRKLRNFSLANGVAKISQKSPSYVNMLIASVKNIAGTKKLRLAVDYKLDNLKNAAGMLYHFADSKGKNIFPARWTGLKTKIATDSWQTYTCEVEVPDNAASVIVTLAVYGAPDYPEASIMFRNPVMEKIR